MHLILGISSLYSESTEKVKSPFHPTQNPHLALGSTTYRPRHVQGALPLLGVWAKVVPVFVAMVVASGLACAHSRVSLSGEEVVCQGQKPRSPELCLQLSKPTVREVRQPGLICGLEAHPSPAAPTGPRVQFDVPRGSPKHHASQALGVPRWESRPDPHCLLVTRASPRPCPRKLGSLVPPLSFLAL